MPDDEADDTRDLSTPALRSNTTGSIFCMAILTLGGILLLIFWL